MDEAEIEAKGLTPLRPDLDRVAAISDKADLARALGETLRADVDALNNTNFFTQNVLGLWVAQDLDAPTQYAPFLLQGGLGMPDRDYYLDPSPHMAEIRTKYAAYVEKMLTLGGVPDAAAKAARIFAFEKKIAASHVSREDSESVAKGNNHWARAAFATRAPGLDWPKFFEAAGLGGQASFVVWQPRAVTGLAALVAKEPLATWKDYLTFRTLARAATYPPEGVRRRAVLVLRDGAHGRAEAPRPLEARRGRHGRRARRGRRPPLRREDTSRRPRRRAPRRW